MIEPTDPSLETVEPWVCIPWYSPVFDLISSILTIIYLWSRFTYFWAISLRRLSQLFWTLSLLYLSIFFANISAMGSSESSSRYFVSLLDMGMVLCMLLYQSSCPVDLISLSRKSASSWSPTESGCRLYLTKLTKFPCALKLIFCILISGLRFFWSSGDLEFCVFWFLLAIHFFSFAEPIHRPPDCRPGLFPSLLNFCNLVCEGCPARSMFFNLWCKSFFVSSLVNWNWC